MRFHLQLGLVVVLFTPFGCGDDAEPPGVDAARSDSSTPDSSTGTDARAPMDARTPTDATATADASDEGDAAMTDAGGTIDGSTPTDAGGSDGGNARDAATARDAGSVDATLPECMANGDCGTPACRDTPTGCVQFTPTCTMGTCTDVMMTFPTRSCRPTGRCIGIAMEP